MSTPCGAYENHGHKTRLSAFPGCDLLPLPCIDGRRFKRRWAIALLALILLAFQTPIMSPQGVYSITTPGPTTISYTATSITFAWGPQPVPVPPVPPPVPPPDPGPPVLTGHVYCVVIYDPAGTPLTAAQQAALVSPSLMKSALNLDVAFSGHQSTEAAMKSWIAHAPASGLPALFLATSDGTTGTVRYAIALPADEAGILAVIQKARGK